MPSKGLALPASFKAQKDLRPSLERNFRHMVSFVNSYVPTYNDEDDDLYLKDGARASTTFTPSQSTHLTTKDYVDTQITSHNHDSAYVNVSGDTMTGELVAPSMRLTAGSNPLKMNGNSLTTAGINYMSWYLSDGTTRTAWMGFGGSSDLFSLNVEAPSASFYLKVYNGTTTANRIVVSGNGPTFLYDRNGAEMARIDVNKLQLASGVSLALGGSLSYRFSLGANNSVQWTNPSGYIQIGPQNTSYCHIYTDRPSFYFNKELLVNGNKVWHAGNDGAGSGLDADLFDGMQSSIFWRSDNDGSGSGLDADLLDGFQWTAFARAGTTTTSAANAVYESTSRYVKKTVSSYKVKRDIFPLYGKLNDVVPCNRVLKIGRYPRISALDVIPVWFKSNADADDKDKDRLGFVLEQLREVSPALVEGESIDQNALLALLYAEVYRLNERIMRLENGIS